FVDVTSQGELIAAHHLGRKVGQVLDVRLLPRQPGEQIIEAVLLLANRQWAEVAVDLACLEKATHARDERARDRRCLRWGRGGDGGHAAARILRLVTPYVSEFPVDIGRRGHLISRYIVIARQKQEDFPNVVTS